MVHQAGKWQSRTLAAWGAGFACLAYLVARTLHGGTDINVYLYAAGQFLRGENIYANNPFNAYYYGPLFALTLVPLSIPDMPVARVLWMLINVGLAMRLWVVWVGLASSLSRPRQRLWTIAVILLAAGFLNHIFLLGQVTILILWLTLEGIFQVARGRPLLGAALVALGINFKIIPLLVLAYLGMRGQLRALAYTLALFGITLLAPAAVHGWTYNSELLRTWRTVINPAGEKFAFEDNDGCQSLNAVLPAYFYDFRGGASAAAPRRQKVDLPRTIVAVSRPALTVILQASRVLLLLVLSGAMLPRSWLGGPLHELPARLRRALGADEVEAKRTDGTMPTPFYWEVAILCLVTISVFPHQMKYSMLYFVPAGAYVLYFYLAMAEGQVARRRGDTVVRGVAVGLMAVLAVSGRDLIGSRAVDILDYYHVMGITVLLFLPILLYCHPRRLRTGLEAKAEGQTTAPCGGLAGAGLEPGTPASCVPRFRLDAHDHLGD